MIHVALMQYPILPCYQGEDGIVYCLLQGRDYFFAVFLNLSSIALGVAVGRSYLGISLLIPARYLAMSFRGSRS